MESFVSRLFSRRGNAINCHTAKLPAGTLGVGVRPLSSHEALYATVCASTEGTKSHISIGRHHRRAQPLGGGFKRACDVFGSLLGIILLLPLFLFTCLLVRAFLGAPVVFA